jgi:hypothetical protein
MGLRGRLGIAICAVALVVPATASANAGDRVSRVTVESYPAIVSVDGATASARPLRGVRRVLDAQGRTVSRSSFLAAAPRRVVASTADTGYACVNNRQRRGFVAYTPWRRSASKDAYYFQYVYSLYKQNRARRLVSPSGRNYRSKQYEMCSTGNAHSRGGNHLSRAVTSFTTANTRSQIIGWKWGKGTRQGTVSASLGFAVPVGPVTINGSVDVHPQDTFTGGQGPDKDASDIFDGHELNQVNAMWEGSDTFRWQGSTHFEGNVGHGLWEYRQSSRAPTFYIEPSVRWFCGHPFGIGCA